MNNKFKAEDLIKEIDEKLEELENKSEEELKQEKEEKLNIIKKFSEKTNRMDLYEKCLKMGEPIITILYNDIKHKYPNEF